MEARDPWRAGIEALVLRYGFYYGPGTWYGPTATVGDLLGKRRYPLIGSGQGRMSFVHIDDAVRGDRCCAMDRGEPGIYNICDDDPARHASSGCPRPHG